MVRLWPDVRQAILQLIGQLAILTVIGQLDVSTVIGQLDVLTVIGQLDVLTVICQLVIAICFRMHLFLCFKPVQFLIGQNSRSLTVIGQCHIIVWILIGSLQRAPA